MVSMEVEMQISMDQKMQVDLQTDGAFSAVLIQSRGIMALA
jgi:hypothetical protein